MKERFLQLHILTAYPPSNVNRDDMGRPKTAVVGGAMRLRISSQSLKRAWRTSEQFEKELKEYIGIRSKRIGEDLVNALVNGGIQEKKAFSWIKKMLDKFQTEPKKEKDTDDNTDTSDEKTSEKTNKKSKEILEQMVHFSPEEKKALDNLIHVLIERKSDPTEDELNSLRKKEIQAADIALFGRMLAKHPESNQDAAAQVAHSFTTHKVAIEDDFFTAVDDLNTGEVDRGSSHLGVMEFGSGIFYTYVCINRKLLAENLQNNEELAQKTIQAFVEAVATVGPSGKQNSFAQHVRSEYILAELGDQQPRSLSMAFQKPVQTVSYDIQHDSIDRLEKMKKDIENAYGLSSEKNYLLQVGKEGNIQGLKAFCAE